MRMRSTLLALTSLLLAGSALAAPVFNRVASFDVALNSPDAKETSAEIVVATDDGMMLVYSDSLNGGVGFIDIADPNSPKPAGFIALGGEVTSVAVIGSKVFAAVDTSPDFASPSGHLAVINLADKSVETTIDLGGQPDSVARNAAGTRIAVAVENERNEEVNDGDLPQLPPGHVVLLAVADGAIDPASFRKVELTGLAATAGEDPEPEYIAFNSKDQIAVTLQENNEIVLIDAATGAVTAHFPAGTAALEGIDTRKDGILDFSGSADVPREPDAVKWLDDSRLVVANEGDWKGGSRGFTIFDTTGAVLFESGAALEHEVARLGHYPEARNKKGIEPETVEAARFGDETLLFVAAERSSTISVYRDTGAAPESLQTLPSGISPEGLVAVPARDLVASANELDLRADGLAGSHVMIYVRAEGEAHYPQIISANDENGLPIGWGALSGAVADPATPGRLFAVNDSVYSGQPAIYTIDASVHPAQIIAKLPVRRGKDAAQKLDLEGITLDGEGGFWLASEGRSDRLVPHALFHVDAEGKIVEEVAFPEELKGQEVRYGAEGVALVGSGDAATLWVAIQREWKDDPSGQVKLLGYNLKEKAWTAVRYPLDAPTGDGWVGLSELTLFGDHLYLVERDNLVGEAAVNKKVYRVPVAGLEGAAALGGDLPVVEKELVRDLLPDLSATNGYVAEKVESLAIEADGTAWLITDNDGVVDSSGETFLWSFKLN